MNLANKYHPKYEPDKWNKDIFINQPISLTGSGSKIQLNAGNNSVTKPT